MKTFRPDRLEDSVNNLARELLGEKYVELSDIKFDEINTKSSNQKPVVLVEYKDIDIFKLVMEYFNTLQNEVANDKIVVIETNESEKSKIEMEISECARSG